MMLKRKIMYAVSNFSKIAWDKIENNKSIYIAVGMRANFRGGYFQIQTRDLS